MEHNEHKEYPKYWKRVCPYGDVDYIKDYGSRYVEVGDYGDERVYCQFFHVLTNLVTPCTEEEFNDALRRSDDIFESVKQAIIDDNGD